MVLDGQVFTGTTPRPRKVATAPNDDASKWGKKRKLQRQGKERKLVVQTEGPRRGGPFLPRVKW